MSFSRLDRARQHDCNAPMPRRALPYICVLAILLVGVVARAEPARVEAGLQAQAEERGETTVFVKLRKPRLPRRASLTAPESAALTAISFRAFLNSGSRLCLLTAT